MDRREGAFIKNTVILALGKFLPMLVSTVTLPVLTACLSKTEYGSYDLIDTLIMLLIPIATLQIQSAAFRFLIECRGNEHTSSVIISNIYAVTIPISCVVTIGVFAFMPNLSTAGKVAVAFYFFVDSLYNASSQVTRGLGGNSDYAISAVTLSVVKGIGIVVSLTILKAGILGVLISLCVANSVAVVFLWARKGIYTYIDLHLISIAEIKKLLSYSWPMVPNNLSNWVLKLSDRLVITAFLGIEANAVYAVANKIPNLLSLAQSVMVMAWQENASIAVKDKDADKYFTRMFDEIFSLMIGVTALLIGATPVIFALLIRGDYADAYNQIPILIFGMFFYCMSSFQGGIYIAHKRTKSVGASTMIAATVNLAVDFALVNVIGITAGSLSTLMAYFVLYVYRMVGTLKFQPMDYKIQKQAPCIILIITMLFLCFMQSFLLNVINIVVGFITFIALNKNLVISLLTQIKKKVSKGADGKG